jgi:head-tail adaptor
MSQFVSLISTHPNKDSEGFATNADMVIASVRAYKEDRHGNERWANMAVFSEASALFRFRKIPDIAVTTDLVILCAGERYNILSVEDIRSRGMYIEVLAKKVISSG